jgi:hypothetical protein
VSNSHANLSRGYSVADSELPTGAEDLKWVKTDPNHAIVVGWNPPRRLSLGEVEEGTPTQRTAVARVTGNVPRNQPNPGPQVWTWLQRPEYEQIRVFVETSHSQELDLQPHERAALMRPFDDRRSPACAVPPGAPALWLAPAVAL